MMETFMRRMREYDAVHFVGIGGIGMSALAEILLASGIRVSGSDLRENGNVRRLITGGARIHLGHRAEHIADARVVVFSSAIDPANPEIIEARRRGIPLVSRADMLGVLMRTREGIALAGAHGKTTTSAMLAEILLAADRDPTLVIGGIMNALGSNARLGRGDALVAEADESDGSFIKLCPTHAVVTNIDPEHMDYYQREENLYRAFTDFIDRVPFYGCVAICIDDPMLDRIAAALDRPCVSYGFSPWADVRATGLRCRGLETAFAVHHRGTPLGDLRLPLPGRHNVTNALGASALALELGIPWPTIERALSTFRGVKRRLEIKGEAGGILFVDDYAHHPTELRATLRTLKEAFADRRMVTLFQPHRFTRTRDLFSDFVSAFGESDVVLIAPIYTAGEAEIPGIDSDALVQSIASAGHPHVIGVSGHRDIQTRLDQILRPGDVFVTLGAGDIWREGEYHREKREAAEMHTLPRETETREDSGK